MADSPQFIAIPRIGAQTIENSDGTSILDVLSAGTNGTRVGQLFAVHDDSAAVIVKLWLNDGTENHLLGMVSLAAATVATPHVSGDFLQSSAWIGTDGALILPSGYKLRASVNAALTAGKKCSVIAAGGDF